METRIRVEYIDFRGVKHHKTTTKEVPDFEEKVIDKILNLKLKSKVVITIEQQILEYLDDNSFGKEFMQDNINECYAVINYWVANKKKVRDEKEEVRSFTEKHLKEEQMRVDFVAIYTHMKPSLKGMETSKKLTICLSALLASYMSASEAYSHITSFSKSMSENIKSEHDVKRQEKLTELKQSETNKKNGTHR